MPDIDFMRMFTEAKSALEGLHTKTANLEEELAKTRIEVEAVTKIYNATAPFVGEQPLPGPADSILPIFTGVKQAAGISIAIRSLLDHHFPEAFTAAQMRERLGESGWSWEYCANPLSTVHTTMVRLVQSGYADEDRTSEGIKCFRSAKMGTAENVAPSARKPPEVRTARPPRRDDFEKTKL